MIPTVDRRDEGPYFCEADNQLGQTGKGELNLIVLHEPKVRNEPKYFVPNIELRKPFRNKEKNMNKIFEFKTIKINLMHSSDIVTENKDLLHSQYY